jgi:hypothetical protein
MARPASERVFSAPRQAERTLSVSWLGEPQHYILLALLTVMALTAAYAVRPVVRVDMGSDSDVAFVRDFHSREIDAAGASERFEWSAGRRVLEIPGKRRGVWIALLQARPGQPENILRDAAVAINDVRVDMPRRTPDSILVEIPPEIGADETLRFELVSPLVGGATPPPDLVGELELAPARTYRWSRAESSIVFPHLGRGAWGVDLVYVAAHPDGEALDAQVYANNTLIGQLPESATMRRARLLVPANLMRDGSLEISIEANTFADPRPLGLFVSSIGVTPIGSVSPITLLPPWSSLALALVIVLGAYASLSVILGRDKATNEQSWRIGPTVWAVVGVTAAMAMGAWFLGTARFPSSFMLSRLAWLMAGSLVLAVVAGPLTRRLFQGADVTLEPTRKQGTPTFLSLLLLIVLISFWIKAIGMVYPYFVAIDVDWHMARARWILEGQLPMLYGTNSPLNETTMPVAEWGENPPVIPYSPWYHMFATVFAFMPVSMAMAANIFSLLLDSSRLVLTALIARKAGLSPRTTLIAAATYAVIPVAFLLHSWGNVPTAFGLWLTLVATVIIYAFWERLHERAVLVTLSVVLLATFLIYTVTGVFMGVFLVLFTLLAWLNAHRGGAWAGLTRQLGPIWIAAGVAMGLALVIYYGQYVPPIIAQTIPYMTTVFAEGPQSVGVDRPPFGAYMLGYIPHLDYRIWPGDYLFYGIGIPMLFTIPGYLALRKKPLTWVLFSTWLTVAVLFMFAGYRISMVDKQIFYMLPVMCISWAVYADRFWQRGRWGRWLVVVVLLYSLATAIDQWILRIVTSPVVG